MTQETKNQREKSIVEGQTSLGIELGSTRIKAILIDETHEPIASGSFEWENKLENGIWTYRLEEVWSGVQGSFAALREDVMQQYAVKLEKIKAIGLSAMMHGYLVFDKDEKLLTPFRTWRNTITKEAASQLTELFQFNIPQRWSIAHLYQAILNEESHVKDIAHMTTLAGYVHWKLTGEKVMGIGEASGVFPIDSVAKTFDERMIEQFDAKIAPKQLGWTLKDILPSVLEAGQSGGVLSEEGARLLDISNQLQGGSVLCPPEGDAGTGMVATNSVAPRTGNVSAGTSVFAMIVLEKGLSRVYEEIDMVTTPAGEPVAMVHCNNFTSDLDAWVRLFGEMTEALGQKADRTMLYQTLYHKALEGEADGGGLLAYNYYSGEHITGFEEGRPLFVRKPDSPFTLANFMRTLLFSAMGTLKIGMNILTEKEQVRLEQLLGHGGLFKTRGVGQQLMAAALKTPVVVMESAGEGGAWGIALLAAYCAQKEEDEVLGDYLANHVFANHNGTRAEPDERDVKGFDAFMERFTEGLEIERAAVDHMR